MPFVKVYIHFVWATHKRIDFLNTPTLRKRVWEHIKENAKTKGIFIEMVNGYSDHCHCLISLSTDQTIEKIAQLIKGESSHWINQQQLTEKVFAWQKEYFAVSVSQSIIEKVRHYIKNQETHHQKKTFSDEYEEFITKYGFTRFSDE